MTWQQQGDGNASLRELARLHGHRHACVKSHLDGINYRKDPDTGEPLAACKFIVYMHAARTGGGELHRGTVFDFGGELGRAW